MLAASDPASDVPAGAPEGWRHADMVALGLTPIAGPEAAHGATRLYAHDVGSYKPTPEWLNPGDWANPEQWNKRRW